MIIILQVKQLQADLVMIKEPNITKPFISETVAAVAAASSGEAVHLAPARVAPPWRHQERQAENAPIGPQPTNRLTA